MSDPYLLRRRNLVHLEDVYQVYAGRTVLDNVDLSIGKGEFVSVVGPSGGGKSTLLRIILGEERPTSGTVFICGEPALFPDRRRGIVYQNGLLYPHLTVLENVLLGLKLDHWFWQYWKRHKEFVVKAEYYLELVGLSNDRQKYPHELSGGMRQRAAIAQALIMEPEILLMDEPFGALDPSTREDLQIHMLEIHDRFKMTVLFVTHDLEEAVYLGTRIVVVSPYYTDDRGDGEKVHRGARIVWDTPVTGNENATATIVKDSPVFRRMINDIKEHGFNPTHRDHVKAFNLTHPDSFQTLTPEEST